MSVRHERVDAVAVAPWELTHNGYGWRDMPGCDEDTRKMNFFLFRRGLLDVEDAKAEVAAEIESGVEVEPTLPQSRLKVKLKRWIPFGGRGGVVIDPAQREAERLALLEAKAKAEEEAREKAARHLALRLRLGKLKDEHLGAVCAVAREAKLSTCAVSRWLNDHGPMMETTIERLRRAVEKAERGELRMTGRRGMRAGARRGEAPAGFVRLKDWVVMKSDELGVTMTAIRMRLQRDKSFWPAHLRENRRVVWVDAREMNGPRCARNDETRMANEERRAA